MNIDQIEAKVKSIDKADGNFIYELLRAYGIPKSSISRLRSGNLNLSKNDNVIIWKKKLFYQVELNADLHFTIDELVGNPNTQRHNPRFIIVTDFDTILSVDTKTGDSLDVELDRLDRHYDFFLPWAGMEKSQLHNENPADIKAAEKVAKLFDEIKRDNPDNSNDFKHELNVFMARLLFCFFAEDTNIFEEDIFTNGISSYTKEDGSDLDEFLNKLFLLLNTPESDRNNPPSYLVKYPHVGGSLFRDNNNSPKFSKRSRQAIIDSGVLDWSEINPDIFGSMMQSVVSLEQRESTGMHYTSFANIMKLIEPLFLNELKEEFEKAKGNEQKLNKLLHRLSKIKIFDPACGSGNFLIIAYKELRKLEIEIIKELGQISIYSSIALDNFYGIEIDDFSREIAILSMWLSKHQMSIEFHKNFGISKPTLPLEESGNIILGNASYLEWKEILPTDNDSEIYLIGNPPYCGAKKQNKNQKNDLKHTLSYIKGYKNLDYISIWFIKGADYIKNSKNQLAFVSTKSIIQGNHVGLFWPSIYKKNIDISFGYTPFKWKNNARDNAGVQVIIISLKNKSFNKNKIIFGTRSKIVKNIGPYLNEGNSVIVAGRKTNMSKLPEMVFGNMPLEGGFLKLSEPEKENLVANEPNSKNFIRPLIGGAEFLKGVKRFCLWINDNNLNDALKIDPIKTRINQVKDFRKNGGEVAKTLVDKSHQFRYRHTAKNNFILIPCTTSEKRRYLQCGFFDENYISLHSAQIIYDCNPFIFSILSSKIHMLWVKAVGGYLGSSIRYSAEICYNTFPFPTISKNKEDILLASTLNILEKREMHSDKTIAQLYDPNKMPPDLKKAHIENDEIVEKCYRNEIFTNDNERLDYLFSLYERMIELEQSENTLFADEVIKKRKRRVNA